MTCPQRVGLVYGHGTDTAVLCPDCGAIVPVPPTIKRRQHGEVREVSRIGTSYTIPAHEHRDPSAIVIVGDYMDDPAEGRFLDADPLSPADLDALFAQILDSADGDPLPF